MKQFQNDGYEGGEFNGPGGAPNPYAGPGFATETKAGKKRKKGGADNGKATRRVVSTQRRLFLVFAVVAGLLAVLLTTQSSKTTYVARSTQAISSLQSFSDSFIETVAIDPNNVEPTAWTGSDSKKLLAAVLEAVSGKRTALPIGSHQQLRPELFSSALEPSVPLGADERLVSISARASAAIIGTLKEGDHVDVYGAATSGLAGLLAANIEVVAVSVTADQLDSASQEQINQKDKQLSDLVPGTPIPGTYVLRVKSSDVARFIAADAAGRIYLALRGATADITPEVTVDIQAALCAGANAATPACQRSR